MSRKCRGSGSCAVIQTIVTSLVYRLGFWLQFFFISFSIDLSSEH